MQVGLPKKLKTNVCALCSGVCQCLPTACALLVFVHFRTCLALQLGIEATFEESNVDPLNEGCWVNRRIECAHHQRIATTVSSREKGIRRREEGETTSSQRTISLQGNQEESRNNLMKVDDDMRNSRNNNDMEDLRGKG